MKSQPTGRAASAVDTKSKQGYLSTCSHAVCPVHPKRHPGAQNNVWLMLCQCLLTCQKLHGGPAASNPLYHYKIEGILRVP